LHTPDFVVKDYLFSLLLRDLHIIQLLSASMTLKIENTIYVETSDQLQHKMKLNVDAEFTYSRS
jgi:hypothetical protein